MIIPRPQRKRPARAARGTPKTRSGFSSSYYWTTGDEIAFLAGLGTGCWREGHHAARTALLDQYLDAMHLRIDWGTVESLRVRAACLDMLIDCQVQA